MSRLDQIRISIVTPTLRRPREVAELLTNLQQQRLLPFEVIIVDGAPSGEGATEDIVANHYTDAKFHCRYIRHGGGTAIQRNVGIDAATGDYIAFVDDDIRLEPDFFQEILQLFDADSSGKIGGITGYIVNQHISIETTTRWRWYKALNLFGTYEPGRYDFSSGYPINRYLQPPHEGTRKIDVMGAGCAVWRHQVFERGLRFSEFFQDFGVLEDAHLALKAGRTWILLECGRARCVHNKSESSREHNRIIARKTAVNYRYVFVDIVHSRSLHQEFRFWRVQLFDLLRLLVYAVKSRKRASWYSVLGKMEGIIAATRIQNGNK